MPLLDAAFRSHAGHLLDAESALHPSQSVVLVPYLIPHFDAPAPPWERVGQLLVERHGERCSGDVAPFAALVTQ